MRTLQLIDERLSCLYCGMGMAETIDGWPWCSLSCEDADNREDHADIINEEAEQEAIAAEAELRADAPERWAPRTYATVYDEIEADLDRREDPRVEQGLAE